MELVRKKLAKTIKKLYGEELAPVDFTPADLVVTETPDGQTGDYASNVAFQICKIAHASPLVVAQKIADSLKNETDFQVSVAGPGFLNFTLTDKALLDALFAGISPDPNQFAEQTFVCEFSDPNPFKVLHVGHLYTSIVGDAISRLLKSAGARVFCINFGGDVGLHVAKTIYAMLRHANELEALTATDATSEARADFLSKCYVEGTQAYEVDTAAKAEITELNTKIYRLVSDAYAHHEIDPCDPTQRSGPSATEPFARAYWLGREWSYAYFAEFYHALGIRFDKYYPESSVADAGKDLVLRNQKTGVFAESAGAVVFPGEKYDLHTRVFINRDGLPTYEAKDLGLAFAKWRDFHFDRNLIITGNDITDYMKVVLKAISLIEPAITGRTLHLTHGNVKLKGGQKMSSRAGNFLKATDVLTTVEAEIEKEFGSVSPELILAAIKYAFLKNKIGADIIFDPAESVSKSGNSGPYLLYAVVRARNLARRGTPECIARIEKLSPQAQLELLSNYQLSPHERVLVLKLGQWPVALADATRNFAPHKLCAYLYMLAQVYNRFYDNVPVVGSEFEPERQLLSACVCNRLAKGLEILGIPVPERI